MKKSASMCLLATLTLAACVDNNQNNNQNNNQPQKQQDVDPATVEAMLGMSCLMVNGTICSNATINGVSSEYILSCSDGKLAKATKCGDGERCWKNGSEPYCATEIQTPFDKTGLCQDDTSPVCKTENGVDYLVRCLDNAVQNYKTCNEYQECKFNATTSKMGCVTKDAATDGDTDADIKTAVSCADREDGQYCDLINNVEIAFSCKDNQVQQQMACASNEFCGISYSGSAYCDYVPPASADAICEKHPGESLCETIDGDEWNLVCDDDGSVYVGDWGTTNCTGYSVKCYTTTDAYGSYSRCASSDPNQDDDGSSEETDPTDTDQESTDLDLYPVNQQTGITTTAVCPTGTENYSGCVTDSDGRNVAIECNGNQLIYFEICLSSQYCLKKQDITYCTFGNAENIQEANDVCAANKEADQYGKWRCATDSKTNNQWLVYCVDGELSSDVYELPKNCSAYNMSCQSYSYEQFSIIWTDYDCHCTKNSDCDHYFNTQYSVGYCNDTGSCELKCASGYSEYDGTCQVAPESWMEEACGNFTYADRCGTDNNGHSWVVSCGAEAIPETGYGVDCTAQGKTCVANGNLEASCQ